MDHGSRCPNDGLDVGGPPAVGASIPTRTDALRFGRVGEVGFEPTTFRVSDGCSNQTELLSEARRGQHPRTGIQQRAGEVERRDSNPASPVSQTGVFTFGPRSTQWSAPPPCWWARPSRTAGAPGADRRAPGSSYRIPRLDLEPHVDHDIHDVKEQVTLHLCNAPKRMHRSTLHSELCETSEAQTKKPPGPHGSRGLRRRCVTVVSSTASRRICDVFPEIRGFDAHHGLSVEAGRSGGEMQEAPPHALRRTQLDTRRIRDVAADVGVEGRHGARCSGGSSGDAGGLSPAHIDNVTAVALRVKRRRHFSCRQAPELRGRGRPRSVSSR